VAEPGEITALLSEWKRGDARALEKLVPLVYAELRRLADACMRGESPGHTLQPTALLHEAYLRLIAQNRADWQNRAQFFRVAAQLMRRILVDHARQRAAAKRGGPAAKADFDVGQLQTATAAHDEVLAVDKALARLGELDAQQCRIVEMRYFGGLSVEETAEALGISPRTVKRDWAMARAWLQTELSGGGLS
jgi:RNA polymerase sigma factor (TIGR02999 family)